MSLSSVPQTDQVHNKTKVANIFASLIKIAYRYITVV